MFRVEENKKIGKHLSKLIDNQYASKRQFCRQYLEEMYGVMFDNRDIEAEVQKMSNRISQIIKGNKSVQTYDLPIFSKLLGVSCEEILSAGEFFVPVSTHLTNYSIASSNDQNVWEQYIDRDDKLILNSDEYGQTVIDYALKFKNFKFLKYLLDKGYIWFVGPDEKDYFVNFGAGTSIKRRPIEWMDHLQYELAQKDKLRTQMVSLAIEHDDIDMLEQLRAREIPSLYQVSYISSAPPDCDKYRNEEMINHIANASEQILEYFSEEFEIKDRFGRGNKFLFPYMSDLIELLIENNNDFLGKMLKVSIVHNQNAYINLTELMNKSVNTHKELFVNAHDCSEEEYLKLFESERKGVMLQFDFYDNENIVRFRDSFASDGILTNVVHANGKSNDSKINLLLQELNDLYDKIRALDVT